MRRMRQVIVVAFAAFVLLSLGALFLGAGSDLSRSMGVPISSPEVEAGFQKVLL